VGERRPSIGLPVPVCLEVAIQWSSVFLTNTSLSTCVSHSLSTVGGVDLVDSYVFSYAASPTGQGSPDWAITEAIFAPPSPRNSLAMISMDCCVSYLQSARRHQCTYGLYSITVWPAASIALRVLSRALVTGGRGFTIPSSTKIPKHSFSGS